MRNSGRSRADGRTGRGDSVNIEVTKNGALIARFKSAVDALAFQAAMQERDPLSVYQVKERHGKTWKGLRR